MKKIIIIGGGAAGAKAAAKAKRLNQNNHIELYTSSDIIAFSLCGLPYFVEGSVKNIDSLIARQPIDFINNGIEVFLNHTATKIIPEKNCVVINNNHIFYDELIIATGASVNIPKIENIKAENIFTLRSLDDAVLIKKAVEKSKKAILLGAGYISIELLEAFLKNGLKVDIVEKNAHFINDLDVDFSEIINNIIKQTSSDNVNMYFDKTIDKIIVDDENKFKGVVLSDGKKILADFLVLSTGTHPNIDIAKNAGIHIGITGAIQVDNKMRTNIENIYAAGDCCEKYSLITKSPMYIGLGTIANKEGRVASINATRNGVPEVFDGILGSTITKFFDFAISKTGLTYKDALSLSKTVNIVPIYSTVTKKDKASYMPNISDLTFKLVADKRSGEILGAQGIGHKARIAQRINTISSALKTRMTIDELLHLDLAYSPPFSSSIDPLLTCAYKLKEQQCR